MGASKYRHFITIQSKDSYTPDSWNENASPSWSTFAQVWAEIKPKSAKESERDETVKHDRSYDVTIRYLANVTTKLRIIWGSRVFNIAGIVNPGERNIELVLSCEEES